MLAHARHTPPLMVDSTVPWAPPLASNPVAWPATAMGARQSQSIATSCPGSLDSLSPRHPCVAARQSPYHRAFNRQNCTQSKQLAHQNLHHLHATSIPTHSATCPSFLLPSRSSCSGRLSTLHAAARCKSPICSPNCLAARAHPAHTATCVVLYWALLPGLLQVGNAPLGSETKCCAPTRDVPQWQRVSTATAILMEREWPLHPFPLQLPLGAVVAAVN